MRKIITPARFLALLALVTVSTVLLSWDYQPSDKKSGVSTDRDTVPKDRKIKNLDDAIEELDRIDMDGIMEKAMSQAEKALQEIDLTKIKVETEAAMREIDMGKIKKDVEKAMSEINWDEVKSEVESAMASVDWEKMQKDIDKSIKIDLKEMEIDLKKAEVELKQLGPKLKEDLEEAKKEIEKAKAEFKEYKLFVDGLEKEGLINKTEGYKLSHRDGVFEINGKEASPETYKKYSDFLKKHPAFTVKQGKDDFNIDMD